MAIFAYSDETIFQTEKLKDVFTLGCGIFITKSEISEDVIHEAMKSLKQIAAANSSAQNILKKTLDKGYFHATDDSNIAKEEFLKAINNHVKGELYVSYYDDWKHSVTEQQKNQKKYFDRCLSSSSLEFFNSLDEINFIIEQRNGISESSIREWVDAIYRMFENSAFNIPSFKTFFPKINISIGDKKAPGLQVTDLLLWSVNKAKSKPKDERWIGMLKIPASYHSQPTEKMKDHSGYYTINTTPVKPQEDYPYRFTKSETTEELINAYVNIERFLRHINNTDFEENNVHLYEGFNKVSTLLKKEHYILKADDLQMVGRIFIRLFDSLPIYANAKDEWEWQMLFHAKHIASIILAKGFLHVERTKNAIMRWRYVQQQNGTLEGLMGA